MAKGTKVADGIKLANQVTLKSGDYPNWSNVITNFLKMGVAKRGSEGCNMQRARSAVAGSEDGEGKPSEWLLKGGRDKELE